MMSEHEGSHVDHHIITGTTGYDSINESFGNTYIMGVIFSYMDVKTVTNCHGVSREFHDAAVSEQNRRQGIQHLSLRHDRDVSENMLPLAYGITNWVNSSIKFKPGTALLLFGGYKQSPDYRKWVNTLSTMTACLPNGCQMLYLDVGHRVLYNGKALKSLAINTTELNPPDNPQIKSSQ